MSDRKLTMDDAFVIAQHEIAAKINRHERLRKYEFEPVRFWRETDRYWVFSTGSKQLMDEGRVPGAVSVCVDKVDGHVWSRKEQERYAQSLSPFPEPPRPVSADGKPMMDVEDALEIAEREISKIINDSEELRGCEFESARLRRWDDHRWVFSAELSQPGGDKLARREIFISVDPFDGRILGAEARQLTEESDNRLSPPESVAA